MAAELGQIQKPAAGSFEGKRKLYCVANVYPLKGAPDDYITLFEKYWNEVARQIVHLEFAGTVKKIFCESFFESGDDAFKAFEKLNEKASDIIKERTEAGALLLPIEHEDILGQYVDWANCLSVVRTKEAFDKIYEYYADFSERRLKYIKNIIESNLSEGEAGLLIIRDEDRVRLQFSNDIEIFLVTPPSYDDIIKWLRKTT